MMVGGRSKGKGKESQANVPGGASNERLQKIDPAALLGEASEMECRLLGTDRKKLETSRMSVATGKPDSSRAEIA